VTPKQAKTLMAARSKFICFNFHLSIKYLFDGSYSDITSFFGPRHAEVTSRMTQIL